MSFKGSKIDELLTLLFMLVAVATIVLYFYDKEWFMFCAGTAIVMRIVQYLLRFIR